MLKWIEFKTENEYIKSDFHAYSLQIHIDDDNNIVIFNAPKKSIFSKEEAIEVCKVILKQLEEE